MKDDLDSKDFKILALQQQVQDLTKACNDMTLLLTAAQSQMKRFEKIIGRILNNSNSSALQEMNTNA